VTTVDDTLDFVLPPELEATTPAELRPGSRGRDDVRLLVARRATGDIAHHRFTDLPHLLRPGDALVINVSKVVPAAIGTVTPDGAPLELHVSTPMPSTDLWSIELRDGSQPFRAGEPGWRLPLTGGGHATLVGRSHDDGRLWLARLDVPGGDVAAHLAANGEPIRYGYVAGAWPLDAYQTVYATVPGSAELPSAGRAFTPELVTGLVAEGIDVVPVVLHCGVSSLEDHEPPYAERYELTTHAARRINSARDAGGRIVAVGTTVVRTLETVTDDAGVVHPGRGWTELIVRADTTLRAVDGLLTGWHEPRASHLAMLEAVTGRALLTRSYEEALAAGYTWHEFGDLHLILP
jgi:S-adenosylmethionine:tRNA ribosyltransferase-isomerase